MNETSHDFSSHSVHLPVQKKTKKITGSIVRDPQCGFREGRSRLKGKTGSKGNMNFMEFLHDRRSTMLI